MALIENKWADASIFEPYVAFKVEPLIRDQGVSIRTDLFAKSNRNQSPSHLRKRMVDYGRNIAMVEAVSLFKAIKRANLTEESDITFLDAYLLAYSIMLHHFQQNKGVRNSAVESEWKNQFANDISYLIFCSGDDLRHGQNVGWGFYRDIRESDNTPSPEFYISLFLEIRRRRTNGNKRPYNKPISFEDDLESNNFGLYLPEEIFSIALEKAQGWSDLAQAATDLFAASDIDFWSAS